MMKMLAQKLKSEAKRRLDSAASRGLRKGGKVSWGLEVWISLGLNDNS